MYISWLFVLSIIEHSCQGGNVPRSSWSWRRQDLWGQPLSKHSVKINADDGSWNTILLQIRGGEAVADATAAAAETTKEVTVDATVDATSNISNTDNNNKKPQTLDQRVRAALQKFGLVQPPPPPPVAEDIETNVIEQANEELLGESSSKSEGILDESIARESASSLLPSIATTATIELEEESIVERSSKSEDSHNEAIASEAVVASSSASLTSVTTPTTDCEDGVCAIPNATITTTTTTVAITINDASNVLNDEDYFSMAQSIATDMSVHSSLAMAALIATRPDDDDNSKGSTKSDHVQAARALIEQELERINQIKEDAPEVQQLVSEGYDAFLSRRALAFAEMNMDDARAILLADQLDEEEEQTRMEEAKREADKDDPETTLAEQPLTAVHTNFDPTQLPVTATPPRVATPNPEPSVPKAAKRSDVVFEATAAQVQELVLESPVPVLLDVYADWCGPCKVLGPALEEMAIKAGGAFRLVKINSDREQVISTTLEVTALPTVFGIRDGQIVHMFQGLPRSNEFIQNFMMNLLMPGYSSFDPPITSQEKKKYADTTTRLAKMAGAACWPFAARERMQDRVLSRLDALVKESGGMAQADDSAKLLRSLLSNVIRDPYNLKFRNVNLANKALAKKVSCFPSSVAILRTVGFADDGGTNSNRLALKPQQKVINVAPLVVARDCIDKWIDKNRYEIAVAARKRKDDMDRAQLAEEAAAKATAAAAAGVSIEDDEDEIEESALLPNSCTIKIRLEGKKKIHEVVLDGDKPLRTVLDALPSSAGVACDAEFQLTCAAKRLIIKSSDKDSMDKSLADHGLLPMASFVVKTLEPTSDKSSTKAPTKSKLSARAAVQKSRKKGSHTMQSIGVYAKDDNNKAELIDGGGGVWYEHDVSDDEGEGAEPAKGGSSPRDQQKDIDQSEPDEEVDEESEPDDVDGEHDNDEPEETS